MDVTSKIWAKAKSEKKTIVLPEGDDARIVKAGEFATKEGLANVVILGNVDEIKTLVPDIDLTGITVVDIQKDGVPQNYTETFFEMRKSKGITMEEAEKTMANPLYYAAMMVKLGDVDGMVGGAKNTTGDLLRPALQIVKTEPGMNVVSSTFVMNVPNCTLGEEGVILFADCAVNPNPTAEELAVIAISTAKTAKALIGIDPKVAMLSFSTMGSAKHELVDKVLNATAIVKEKAPDLLVDGELQLDAAIVPSVGASKAPNSPVAGKANVLVFPDLQAGNIGYKLVQRLAGAEAIGPISQGFARPINDLSRGCSIEDVINVIAITAVQAIG